MCKQFERRHWVLLIWSSNIRNRQTKDRTKNPGEPTLSFCDAYCPYFYVTILLGLPFLILNVTSLWLFGQHIKRQKPYVAILDKSGVTIDCYLFTDEHLFWYFWSNHFNSPVLFAHPSRCPTTIYIFKDCSIFSYHIKSILPKLT